MENKSEVQVAGQSRGLGALMEKMGMEWLEAMPDRVSARIPVEGNTQPYGLLHGGASAALAEHVASVGAWLADQTKITAGIEIKVNHIRPATKGWVTATGTPLHRGRTIHVWEIRLTDDEGRLTAYSTCTVAVSEPKE